MFVCVCANDTMITRNRVINPHQTRFVGKGSDHLQLIKFWPSCAPGKESAVGEIFWVRLTTASAQCLRLSERFFHYQCNVEVSGVDVLRPTARRDDPTICCSNEGVMQFGALRV